MGCVTQIFVSLFVALVTSTFRACFHLGRFAFTGLARGGWILTTYFVRNPHARRALGWALLALLFVVMLYLVISNIAASVGAVR